MALLEMAQQEVGGFHKEIEAGSMGLMMDILQRYQYKFPVKSSIRELVSNGLDAVQEREVAKKILSGKNVVADFFEEREGEIYKDSKFDPNYYDPKYLSDDLDVYITYHVGDNMEKDKVTIKDYGVGLGQYRLSKYFNLGYSSKRLSKLPLGKFGLGNKSPLSINDYYTVESRYNGFLFRFNIYSGKVEPLIPQYDLETGKENASFVINSGIKDVILYALETTEKNGVTVTIEAKKHHKSEYEEAVKSQLPYFDNVRFFVETGGIKTEIPFRSKVLYEDDVILLSDNTYFSKPHILLNRVNYGFIDFDELELEHRNGNIGLKINPEDVEVSPSRESLIWNEKTKNMVVRRFKDTVLSATKLVQEELSSEDDFLRWVIKCVQVENRYSNQDSVIGRLANLVSLKDISPSFKGGLQLKHAFQLLRFRKVYKKPVTKANKKGAEITRDEASIDSLPHHKLILKSSATSSKKDKYLLSLYPDGFLTLDQPWWKADEEVTNKQIGEMFLYASDQHTWKPEDYRVRKFDAENSWYMLGKSVDVLRYEDIVIPEDFKETDDDDLGLEEQENMTEEEKKLAQLSYEERRKLEGKVLVNTPRTKNELVYRTIPHESPIPDEKVIDTNRLYEWQKLEIPVREISNWSEEEIYYGNEADIKTLEFVALLTRNTTQEELTYPRKQAEANMPEFRKSDEELFRDVYKLSCDEVFRCAHFFNNPKIKIIKVAQQHNKLYKDFKHIRKFFAQQQGKTITMSSILIKWNTARQLKLRLNEVAFLYNFPFNTARQDSFRKLQKYVRDNYNSLKDFGKITEENSEAYETMVKHLDKVQLFQEFVKKSQSPEEISTLAKELWKSDTIEDGCAVELEVLEELQELVDWSSSISTMLRHIPELTGMSTVSKVDKEFDPHYGLSVYPIPEKLHYTIASYLESKGVS